MQPRALARSVLAALSSDEISRTAARHGLLDGLARRLGFRVYNKNLLWTTDAEFVAVWSEFAESTSDIKDRQYVLWSIARSTATLEGDTVECGSFNGASSYLICAAGEARHHIFDSFEGLSAPGAADRSTDSSAKAWQRGDLAASESRVAANLEAFDVVTYRGWIPSRFEEVSGLRFKLVHVDVDLYEPTRDSVQFFFDRLVPGGILVCDDYGFTTCPGATRAMDELALQIAQPVVSLTTGQGLLFRR